MSSSPLWSAGLVILGALITLIANIVTQITMERVDASARWDQSRLDAFSTFSTVMGAILRSASKASAKQHLPDLASVFERLVLLGSSEAVLAAERARTAGSDYVSSLVPTDADCVNSDGDGIAYTVADARRVRLSPESSRLQLEGFDALNAVVREARKQLGIKALSHEAMGRPL
jgi:hypothetical protein